MRLKAPKGCGGVSFGGREYPAVKGVVEVPDEAQVLLEPGYGFTQIFEPVKPSPEEEAEAKAKAEAEAKAKAEAEAKAKKS